MTDTRHDALLSCHLREKREGAGQTLSGLAQRVGISRQALSRIESGAAVPGTQLALLLARELGCLVEDLFSLRAPRLHTLTLGPARVGTRVRLAAVDDRWLALPLTGETGLRRAADGTVTALAGDRAEVDVLGARAALARTALIAGCDPALDLLCERVSGPERAAWVPRASLDALWAAARGEVHAAGLHLGSAEQHREVVARELPGARLLRLWQAEQGLIVAAGNPRAVGGVADLARPELRLVTRAPGAGGRVLLDTWLTQAGLGAAAREARHAGALLAATPLEAAAALGHGHADVAPGPRSAARAYGLHFLPLHAEAFDLAVPERHLGHPGVQALLNAARSLSFQEDLRSLGGYDPAGAEHLDPPLNVLEDL
ncbi:substrate-binding domain-containing protein [Deinococcus radiotolerans]|uniref:HTH cro/C1-type domain-containing protein n=1 Tax=Deinococcus radiotolerans TaxID=1309407 RepID=A0ABQ2FL13_9DEIO|nr:substrate-binding domain-containing protein [Deinococcus radiotolerans]GGL00093.1 hypothetical protein GCM10010844_18120 [Deinococcus radiotolerans]